MARISLSALALVMCASVALGADNRATEEDAAVIRAALAEECAWAGSGYHVMSTAPLPIHAGDQVPADWADAGQLSARLIERSTPPGNWSGYRICDKMLLRDERDIRRAMASSSDPGRRWKNLRRVWPGALGLKTASLPAYSEDGRRAVVVVNDDCGFLCGSMDIFELEKVAGAWRRVRDRNLEME